MSIETSRKLAWVGKTEAIRELTNSQYERILSDIVNAESEDKFKKETKNFLDKARKAREEDETKDGDR